MWGGPLKERRRRTIGVITCLVLPSTEGFRSGEERMLKWISLASVSTSRVLRLSDVQKGTGWCLASYLEPTAQPHHAPRL